MADIFETCVTYYLQPTTRHYVEMLFVNIFLFDEYFSETLCTMLAHQENIKIQPLMSLLYVTSYYLLYRRFDTVDNFMKLCKFVSLNIGNNTSFSRYLSQYVLLRLSDEGRLATDDPEITVCLKIMERNRENLVLVRLFEDIIGKYHKVLSNPTLLMLLQTRFMNERLEIVHGYVCDQFKDVSLQSTIGLNDDSIVSKPDVAVAQALNTIFGEVEQLAEAESEDPVFQRKIDNVLSMFPVGGEGQALRKAEIVVVASLLDKLPNIGNLTRTCEVFGVKELVIPSKSILKDPAFLNITVTAEKWMPFVECAPANLAKFLMMYRANGYTVDLSDSDRSFGANVQVQAHV